MRRGSFVSGDFFIRFHPFHAQPLHSWDLIDGFYPHASMRGTCGDRVSCPPSTS